MVLLNDTDFIFSNQDNLAILAGTVTSWEEKECAAHRNFLLYKRLWEENEDEEYTGKNNKSVKNDDPV